MNEDTKKNDNTQNTADILTSSLLDTKKKHDQDKTVTKEEVDYLNKGTDYLSSFLTGQGVELEERVPTKGKPLTEEELNQLQDIAEEISKTVEEPKQLEQPKEK